MPRSNPFVIGALFLLSLGMPSALHGAQDAVKIAQGQDRPAKVPGGVYHTDASKLDQLPTGTWLGPAALPGIARQFGSRLLPNDGGTILLGLVVLLAVAGRFAPFRARWNLDLLALLLVAVFMAGSIDRWAELERTGYLDTSLRAAQTFAFTAIYLLTLWWTVRATVGAMRDRVREWSPNLSRSLLVAGAASLVLMNVAAGLLRTPDDAGIYTNLGAQRLLETGKLPYGDEKLRGGAAATYGPVLYLSHVPLQLLSGRAAPNPASADPLSREGTRYRLPPMWATKVTTLAFHLLALVSLFVVGRRLAGTNVAWALVCLYAGSPYVFGLGGQRFWAGGLPFISHIAPTGLVLLAFALVERPALAGMALALAAGTVYYPALFFPAWFGYYLTRRREGAARFTFGFGATGLALAGLVVALTDTQPGENALRLFLTSTVEHQEGANQYGSSPFGFFGMHPALAGVLQRPLVAGSSLLKPMFLLGAAFALAGFVLGRNRRPAQLALLTAAIAASVQLWKTHASGTYVEWYYPLLLIGLLADRRPAPAVPAPPPTTRLAPRSRPRERVTAGVAAGAGRGNGGAVPGESA